MNNNTELKCLKCGSIIRSGAKFCTNCGSQVATSLNNINKAIVKPSDFPLIYNNSDDSILEYFLSLELKKAGIDEKTSLIPENLLKRKNVFNIIFSILLFIYISLIFFHFPIYTYIIGAILLIIFYLKTNKYNFMEFLKKEVKARPSEKFSNIVMSTKLLLVEDTSKKTKPLMIISAIAISCLVFLTPHVMYEKMENGYAVRFYTFGLTNYKTAEIPSTYRGENVVSLRGNTFSNMPYLEKVTLPDTIVEIRGQAFKNCKKLREVNMPKKLEYLGGGAFYNAISLESIEFPDTLTYMGGETFYNAYSLKSVRLSENLSEIRGDSFEYCYALTSITIPDSVTRIGGHAFYGDSNLSEVNISENSSLKEIGSSAFRLCDNLYEIYIPSGTEVNERAFKESPTEVKRYGETFSSYY